MRSLTRVDTIVYAILALVFAYAAYLGFSDPNAFDGWFAAEDGAVEYGTAIMLFGISFLSLYRLIVLWNIRPNLWRLGTFMFFILFMFGGGEEISWGQRIFGVESGEFFTENNAQGETNLHNLVVGGKKINKIVFSQLLMIVMVLYLIVVPIIYRKLNWLKDLFDRFAVPVVKWHHTIAFLACTAIVASIPADRKWEVYEFAFGAIFLLIFLYPFNKHIFSRG